MYVSIIFFVIDLGNGFLCVYYEADAKLIPTYGHFRKIYKNSTRFSLNKTIKHKELN